MLVVKFIQVRGQDKSVCDWDFGGDRTEIRLAQENQRGAEVSQKHQDRVGLSGGGPGKPVLRGVQ